MGNAIAACFRKYATFSGRASRKEYWFFYLFYMIMYLVGTVIGASVAVSQDSVGSVNVIQLLFILPLLIPQLAAGFRRVHDTGRSGWFLLIPIYNIILLASSGTPGDNKYGSPPTI